MDRILNYTFSFILIYLFIAEGQANDHLYIVIALILAILISFTAFFLNWITIDALPAVTVIGTVTFGLAGWMMAVPLLVFFISGSMLSLNREMTENNTPETRANGIVSFRRNGFQIWANGFWVTFFVCTWFVFELEIFMVAGLASLAAAMADTWATEIGQREGVKTVLATTFRNVPPGTEGGVSTRGLAGAFAGAAFTGLIYYILTYLNGAVEAVTIIMCGFLGSCFDSWLGAILQKGRTEKVESITENVQNGELTNNLINFTATGFGGISAFIVIWLI